MAFVEVTPIIPNTTMQQFVNANDVATAYKITPNEGYVMHNKGRDFNIYDDYGNVIDRKQGFTSAPTTCPISYDFTPFEMTCDNGQTVTAYGTKEYFVIPESEIPADQIFGGGTTPKPEVM